MKNLTVTVNGVAYNVTVEESAAGAAPGRFRGAMLCHTTRRLTQTEGPHGFSTGVKQIAQRQIYNYISLFFVCVQVLHSDPYLHRDSVCRHCLCASLAQWLF